MGSSDERRSDNVEQEHRMTRCMACQAVVASTRIGMVETRQEFAGFSSPQIDAYVTRHFGSENQPCGCIDGGLLFDFTDANGRPSDG
jgi:hypothetical protein